MFFLLAFLAPPLVGAFAMGMDALERRAATTTDQTDHLVHSAPVLTFPTSVTLISAQPAA